jgi:hypothetical protein
LSLNGPLYQTQVKPEFKFSGKLRKFAPVKSIHLQWPSTAAYANSYIEEWVTQARQTLRSHRLSTVTLDMVVTHVSRKDGTIRMTNGAIAARMEGRSISSIDRDIQRIKSLGYFIAFYEAMEGRRGKLRVLKLSLPVEVFQPQRIPLSPEVFQPQRIPPYVEVVDIEETRNV